MENQEEYREEISPFRKIKNTLKTLLDYSLAPYHISGFLYNKIMKTEKESFFFKESLSEKLLPYTAFFSSLASLANAVIANKLLKHMDIAEQAKLYCLFQSITLPFVTNIFSYVNTRDKLKIDNETSDYMHNYMYDNISSLEKELGMEICNYEDKDKEPIIQKSSIKKSYLPSYFNIKKLKHEEILEDELKLEDSEIIEIMKNPNKYFKNPKEDN